MIQDAFTHADYSIHILDPEWRFLHVNGAFLALHGYREEGELLGRDESLIHPDPDQECAYGELHATLASGKSWRGDLLNRAQGGSSVPVHVSASPLFREERIAGYLVFTFDKSQVKALEQQLFRASRMAALGTLGAALAHELNNPLSSILLDAEYLRDAHAQPQEPFDDAAALAAAESVIRGVERVRRVLNHLLLYARKDGEASWSTLFLDQLFQDSLLFMGRQLQSRGIRVDVQAPEALCVSGNRTLLESVLHNLLGNSRDAFASRPGRDKWIRIEADHLPKQGMARIRYTDNAGGVPPEIRERIFDPFFTTKGSQGTGLGLSVCRQILGRHGGSIACDSRDGETEFTLLIPGRLAAKPEAGEALTLELV